MTDILLNDDFTLRIENGDFLIDDSDTQNQQLIVKANKGNFLESPTLGVGIDNYLNSALEQHIVKLKKDIQVNFLLDNYALLTLKVEGDTINFTARAK
jgi:hypothetical protein